MRLINEDDVLEIIERVTNEAVEKKQPKYLIQPRIIAEIAGLPTVEAEPVKHEQRIDHEKLIGIFGTLCDYMVDNCRCDVFCPYADTKDESDECEAWRTIQKIRRGTKNETD